jgi:hypothetical protein
LALLVPLPACAGTGLSTAELTILSGYIASLFLSW